MSRRIVREEINALDSECVITTHNEFTVYLAEGSQIPHTLKKIDLLRIKAFAQEKKKTMLDEFDPHYFHLFIMHNETDEILGGYRLGFADKIIEKYGVTGLYSSTLNTISPNFFQKNGSLIELGQSFISPENKGSAPVMPLLIKGIILVMLCNNHSGVYGLASIFSTYAHESRDLIVHCLRSHCSDTTLLSPVTPKYPYHPKSQSFKKYKLIEDEDWILSLDKVVREIELNKKGLPMFIKFYLTLNPLFISVGMDPDFDDCIDCFMMGLIKDSPIQQLIK